MNNKLILRTLISPFGDTTKGSVLSQSELDDNFIYLKGQIISNALNNDGFITLYKTNGETISLVNTLPWSGITNTPTTIYGYGITDLQSYWVSGSTGLFSMKAINDSTTDATGNYSNAEGYNTLASGYGSHASGYNSITSGLTSFIHSYTSRVVSDKSVVLGGFNNNITAVTDTIKIESDANSIIGGSGNTISIEKNMYSSAIISGVDNKILRSQFSSIILGGSGNTISGYVSSGINGKNNSILGGYSNKIEAGIAQSSIIGGHNNKIGAEAGNVNGVIAGGHGNNIFLGVGLDGGVFIGGGINNEISGWDDSALTSSLIGGSNNKLITANNSVIVGGQNITGTTADTVYVPNLNINYSGSPSGTTDTLGEVGAIRWDNTHFYWKTNNGWLRVSGSTF